MNAPYKELLDRLIAREGGLVDHPADPGGATNFGLSLAWARRVGLDANGDGKTDREDILVLDAPLARALFEKYFLKQPRIDCLPEDLIEPVLDFAVNAGPRVAIGELQRALNGFARLPDSGCLPDSGVILLVEDGVLGPRTLWAATQGLVVFDGRLLEAYARARCQFYARLAAANPANCAFIAGWLKRASEFLPKGCRAHWDAAKQGVIFTEKGSGHGR